MAEGKGLETNSLGGEKRSPWYDCGNWPAERFSKGYAPLRRVETATVGGLGNLQG